MAMSDCEKCWETPCSCGWGYRNLSFGHRVTLAMAVLGVTAEELQKVHIPTDHPMKSKPDSEHTNHG